MSSAQIQVNSEWLKWARETAYYDLEEISKKMRVKEDTVKQWENTGTLDYDHLLKLAEFYCRPPMIFFNKDNPKQIKYIIPDYRTINSKNQDNISPTISFEIRSAKTRRENLLLLEEESDEYEIPLFDFPLREGVNEDPESLAWAIREWLGISTAKSLVYKNKKGLEFWINKLEELGVLVFQFYGIKPEEMRGYALTYDKLPIIGINNQDHPNGKKFTLFHELAHLIIKKEGISSFNKYDLPNSDEIFCNAVAAEVLVPEKDLLAKVDQIGVRGNWTNDKINKLKNFFNVSSEVIVRRLLTLKLVEPDFYKSKKEEWNKFIPHSGSKAKERTVDQGRRERDEPCSDREKDINLINTRKAVMAIKRNGVYYTEIVLSAYDSQLITNSTMTGYLGETLQVVEEIRKKLLEEIEE